MAEHDDARELRDALSGSGGHRRQRPRPPRTLETRRHPVIERDAAGTKLTERMSISGPLGGLIGRVVRRRLAALFVAMTEQSPGKPRRTRILARPCRASVSPLCSGGLGARRAGVALS